MNELVLDVGETSVTAKVVDCETRVQIGGAERVLLEADSPLPQAVEIPAPRLWQAAARAARRAVWRSGVIGMTDGDIKVVVLTTFMPGLVLLGKNDRPLGSIWLPNDRRAAPAARQVQAHVGPEFHAAFGRHASTDSISALHWRQQLARDPYVSHRMRSYLHVAGWLAFHLTGEKVFDAANAAVTGLCLPGAADWSSRWCSYFEVERDWLPSLLPRGATVGAVRAAVAAEIGVPAGIPVAVGHNHFFQ